MPIAYGDVDDDGKIDVSDAVLILVAYAKSCADQPNSFSDRQKIVADYNQDGKIEVGDAVQVLTSYKAGSRTAAAINSLEMKKFVNF